MAKKIFLLFALILLTMTNVEATEEQQPDLPFEAIASTYNQGDTEMVALIRMKENGSLGFLVAADGTNGIGLIPYSKEIYNFYLNADERGEYPPLIFGMLLPGQTRGQADDELGAWKEDLHMLPVYALFTVQGGHVICEKPFSSASGLEATHYQATIQNPNYTKLIETFMTKMPQLHNVVELSGITLP